MNTLSTLLPGTIVSRGFAALRTKQDQLVLNWRRARAQREEEFRITQELADCSNRQLADLGLCRSDIPDVAHGTFRSA